jgi:hypothetical protein
VTASRRTTVLTVVAVSGSILVPAGVVLLLLGSTHDRGGESVAGILVLVPGLVCLRILFWVRRARLLADLGRSLHVPDPERHDEPR